MRAAVLPVDLFDFCDVHFLPAEHKLLLAGAFVNPRVSACGVVTLTAYVCSLLGLTPAVAAGIAGDLARRGLIAFDSLTQEFFMLKTYEFWRTPTQAGEGSPWAAAVTAAIAQIRSTAVRTAVVVAIEQAPSRKLNAIAVPTNSLTAMPMRGRGGRWAPSELLVYLCVIANPAQTVAGTCVVDDEGVGALASLPPATVLECLSSLDASGALTFDFATREIFVAARLQATHPREKKSVVIVLDALRSRRVRHAARHAAQRKFPGICTSKKRTSPKNKEKTEPYALVDGYVDDQRDVKETKLAIALLGLTLSAKAKKPNSDAARDAAATAAAVEFARQNKLDDVSAAAAINALVARGGWPAEAVNALKILANTRRKSTIAAATAAARELRPTEPLPPAELAKVDPFAAAGLRKLPGGGCVAATS